MAHFDVFSVTGARHLGKPVEKGEIFSVTVRDEASTSIIPITRTFVKKKAGENLVQSDLREAIRNARDLDLAYPAKKFRIGIRKFTFAGLKRQ